MDKARSFEGFPMGSVSRALAVAVVSLVSIGFVFPGAGARGEPATTILDNGDSANRVDIVILGDGYLAAELPGFASDAAAFVDDFFAKEPFTEYGAYFNVHRVDVTSAQSGADHPDSGIFKDTAFDAAYDCAGIQRLICVDVSKVFAVLDASVSPNQRDIAFVIVNDSEYGGSGGAVAVASINLFAGEVAIHEVGHSFGLLADEYDTGSCTTFSEPPEPNVTIETARAAIKWNSGGGPPNGWIEAATPVPTTAPLPAVPGLYEGAKYCPGNVYRPTHDSLMRTLERPFEQVNEEQLVKRIYNLVALIDSVSPPDALVEVEQDLAAVFSLSLLEPLTHSLDVGWTLNGVDGGSGPQFILAANSLAPGTHSLSARVEDVTARVRHDPSGLLTQVRNWTLSIVPSSDVDGDGVINEDDNCPDLFNPDQADNDGDAMGDVCDGDDDDDGMPDSFETDNGLNPFDPGDAEDDADGDGASNLTEYLAGTDPLDPTSKPKLESLPWLPPLLLND